MRQRKDRSCPRSYCTNECTDEKRAVTSVSHSSPSLLISRSVSRAGLCTPSLRTGLSPPSRSSGSAEAGEEGRLAASAKAAKMPARSAGVTKRTLVRNDISPATYVRYAAHVNSYAPLPAELAGSLLDAFDAGGSFGRRPVALVDERVADLARAVEQEAFGELRRAEAGGHVAALVANHRGLRAFGVELLERVQVFVDAD